MGWLEVFCCINAIVFLLQKVFKGRTKYQILKKEMLLNELLDTLPKRHKKFYQLIFFMDAIFDLISLIILCKVISRFVG